MKGHLKRKENRYFCWDEENRLSAVRDVSDLSQSSIYIYDAGGERVWKLNGEEMLTQVNGQTVSSNIYFEKTLYTGPYLVKTESDYTKHYYIEGERVCSKIGGGFSPASVQPADSVLDFIHGDYELFGEALLTMCQRHLECVDYEGEWELFKKLDPAGNVEDSLENLQYFYHPDHLGSAAVISFTSGRAYQHLQYFPFGELFVSQRNSNFDSRYKFSAKELDNETNYTYFGARYYDSDLSSWLSVDPMADQRNWVSPYSYCQNSPVIRTDPTGALDNPIYDLDGNFLGTDDRGLQGDAIIMSKSNFERLGQGMSHSDAMAAGSTLDNMSFNDALAFANNGNFSGFLNHYNSLSSRPDYDGVMSYNELLAWGRKMGDSPVFLDASKINIGDVYIDDFGGVGNGMFVNTTMKWTPLDTYGAWGKNYMRLMSPDGSVKMSPDRFDYDYHNLGNAWDEGFGSFLYEAIIRTPAIFTLRQYHGINGSLGFDMYPYGYTKAKVKVPYTGPGSGEELLKSMDWRTYR